MKFQNPANGYVESVPIAPLCVLVLGPLYFASKGIWSHALVSLVLAPLILPWLLYPFFANQAVREHYGRKGWIEVK